MGEIPIYTSKEKQTVPEPTVPLFSRDAIAGVSELARHNERRQMQDDLVAALKVERAYSQWQDAYLDHPETGFLSRRRTDTEGGYEAFRVEAARKYLELNDGLENTNQRTLFEKRYQDRIERAQDQIAAHEARETDLHRRTVLGDASITEARRAIELIGEGDGAGADEAMELASRFLGQSLSGVPAEQQDQARRLLVSGVHGEIFNQRLSQDPIAASQYLSVNQKAIEPLIYERFQQKAQRKIEKTQGRALFEAVYTAEANLADILLTIDASDAPDPLKSIARDLVDDKREIERAEKIAFEKQQTQAIEDATHHAAQLIDGGTPFEALPDDVMDILPPDHRRALRTIYTQKISGDPAPYNASLESDLHDSWIRAINGESAAFLKIPLARHMGSHGRERLALWGRRQSGLKTVNPKYMGEVNRRKLAMTTANGFIERVVEAGGGDAQTRVRLKGRLNEAATGYIFAWHDAHPGQVMEPKFLLESLGALVGPVPTEAIGYDSQEKPLFDVEAAEEMSSLPNRVTKALKGLAMNEHGVWLYQNGAPLINEDEAFMDDQGNLIIDQDGRPIPNPFSNLDIKKVAAPLLAAPAATAATISALTLSGILNDQQRDELQRALQESKEKFSTLVGELVADNPALALLWAAPDLQMAIQQRNEAVDPNLVPSEEVLPAAPAIGGNGIEAFPAGFPPPERDSGIETFPDQASELGGLQIEVMPDQSDHEFGEPQILESEESIKTNTQSDAEENTSISLKKSDHRPESLNNDDARDFYNGRISKAREINEKIEDLVEGAHDAYLIRNKERTLSRRLMKDRKEAERIDRIYPNKTYKELMERYSKDGYEGTEVYEIIRKKAFKTNPKVNEKYGTRKQIGELQ